MSLVKRLGLWACAVGCAASACSESAEPPPPCPPEEPAFRIVIGSASGAVLPEDTELVVEYQGSQVEGYALAAPPEQNEDVCCRPSERLEGPLPPTPCGVRAPAEGAAVDGGAGSGVVAEVLLCDLWTNGNARVTVSANGYPELEQILEASHGQCGIETVEVELFLAMPEAGLVE